MKTRILATALALTMVLGMTSTVFAADLTSNTIKKGDTSQQAETTIKYTVGQTYEVTIPAEVSLTESDGADGYKGTAKIKAEKVLIADGNALTVKLSAGEDGFVLEYGNTNPSKITYTIQKGTGSKTDVTAESNTVLTVTPKENGNDADGANTGEETLTFTAASTNIAKATKAGEHTDTLTFTVSVDKKTE